MVEILVFRDFGDLDEKNRWTEKVHLAVMFSKIRQDVCNLCNW